MKRISRYFGSKSTGPRNESLSSANEGGIVDEDAHVIDTEATVKHGSNTFYARGNLKGPQKLYAILKRYPDVKRLIDRAGWSKLLDITLPKSDQAFVGAITERWWDTTHTFHLPYVELGISPSDFTWITGISVGVGTLLPAYNDDRYRDAAATCELIMPGGACCGYKSSGIPLSALKLYLKDASRRLWHQDHNENVEQIARVFLLYTLASVFFPNASSTALPGWYSMVENLDLVGTFDWGNSILARIFYGLDIYSRRKMKSIGYFWQFIEYCMYEYLGTCTPVLVSADTDYWPRISKWAIGQRAKSKGVIKNKSSATQEQIEMRSPECIKWEPYKDSQWVSEEAIARAYVMSTWRVLLWDPQIGFTWYLGDRCFRQLCGSIAIPAAPPTPMSRITREEYDRLSVNGWPACFNFITRVDQCAFDEYWRENSRGPILPPLSRRVNTDSIGYAAVVPSHIRIPHPPVPTFSPTVYATQPRHSTSGPGSQGLRHFSWTVDVAAPFGAQVSLDVPRPHRARRLPPPGYLTQEKWRELYEDAREYAHALQGMIMSETRQREDKVEELHAQIDDLQRQLARARAAEHLNPTSGAYFPTMEPTIDHTPRGFSTFARTGGGPPQFQFSTEQEQGEGSSTQYGGPGLDQIVSDENALLNQYGFHY